MNNKTVILTGRRKERNYVTLEKTGRYSNLVNKCNSCEQESTTCSYVLGIDNKESIRIKICGRCSRAIHRLIRPKEVKFKFEARR